MTTQPTPPSAKLNLRGAVDLGALAARNTRREEVARRAAADPDAVAQGSPFVVDVTEETFAELVQSSVQVPLVLDLWAEGYDTGADALQALADEYAGAFLLGRIDAQAEPGLAQSLVQSLQARAIPLVAAIVKGQPIPLFTGSYPTAEEIRPVLEEVLRVAEANGVTGRVEGAATAAEAEPAAPPVPPLHAEALAAVEAGDFDAATAAWTKALAQDPATPRRPRAWPGSVSCAASPAWTSPRRGRPPPTPRTTCRPRSSWPTSTSSGATSRTRSPACSASCSAPWGGPRRGPHPPRRPLLGRRRDRPARREGPAGAHPRPLLRHRRAQASTASATASGPRSVVSSTAARQGCPTRRSAASPSQPSAVSTSDR